ncbi:MAG: LptF/LptG family permease [Planctomycetota bacterium]
MPLIDRSIAREYLINALTLLIVLLSFIVAIDVSLNIGRFAKAAEEVASQGGEPAGLIRRGLVTVWLIGDFWWPKLLQLYNYLLGIVLVGAMGFTCSQLVRRRELVALLAAGQPLQRVGRPILIVALGFTLLAVVNQELFLPRAAHLVTRDHGQAGVRLLGASQAPLVSDSLGRSWYAQSFDADQGVLEGVYVWERETETAPGARVRAESARWRDGGWDLTGGVIETRGRDRTTEAATPQPNTITRLETDLDPTALRMRQFAGYAQALSVAQLTEMIRTLDRVGGDPVRAAAERDRLERYRFGRFAILVCNLLGLVIAMPFFLTRLPQNMALQSLRCAPVAVLALMGGIIGANAAIPGVPAAVGVFFPVVILLAIAIPLVTSVRT